MRRATAVFLLLFAAGSSSAVAAQSGNYAILMPGAGGAVPIDFLIRNRDSFDRAGVATKVTTSPGEAVSLAKSAEQNGHRVILIGMSRGTIDVAKALAAGAPADAVVFVSGNYKDVVETLGSPGALPNTLAVHHSADKCGKTRPEGARRFINWSRGKASIRWINTTGTASKNPCGPTGAHGFFRQDEPAVSAVIDFIQSQ